MRILFVVPYTPTPIRVRPYSFLRFLAQRGHEVTLATLWENESERAALAQLERDGFRIIAEPLTRNHKLKNAARAMLRGIPLQAEFCVNAKLRERILRAIDEQAIEVAHVEHLRGAYYGLAIQQANKIPVVWDSVDCISHLFQQAAQRSRSRTGRWMARLELGKTRAYEGWLARQFPRVIVTSPTDQHALSELAHGLANISVVSNGVDLGYFCPIENAPSLNTIVYSGKMSYHANVTAALYLAQEIMPLVWQGNPSAKLVIAGSRPPAAIQSLSSDPRITVTGYVEDLRQPLRQATLAVAPLLYGAGIQNKVLEAMACGTPVIATSQAVSALAIEAGRDCLVVDSAQSLAEAILQVLGNSAAQTNLRAQLSVHGRQFVERHHDWHTLVAQLEQHYTGLCQARPSPQAQLSMRGEYSDVHKSNSTGTVDVGNASTGAREHAPLAT